jgi:hypothetical protein
MADAVTTRYVIKTSTGDRGPFSSADISKFLEDGRLRPSTRILDIDTNRAITAEDAVRACFAAEETTAISAESGAAGKKERAREQQDTDELLPQPTLEPAQAARDRRRRSEDLHEATDAIVAAAGGRSPSALERISPAAPATPPPSPAVSPTPRPASGAVRSPRPAGAVSPVTPVPGADDLAITVTVRKEREEPVVKPASLATTVTVRPGQIVTPAKKAVTPIPADKVTTVRTVRRSRAASTAVDVLATQSTRQNRRPAPAAPRSRQKWLIIGLVLVGFAILICVATVVGMMMMKRDRFTNQASSLLHDCLAHPEIIALYPDVPALVPLLISRDSPAALVAAKLERGAYEGYKPAYDEVRYRDGLREAIAKQIESPEPALLSSIARDLVSEQQPSADQAATARALAEKAVDIDESKNWRSLDTLAWVLFKSGNGEEAQAVEQRAMDAASDPVARAECNVAQEQIRSGH